jgi:tetratricopeptide (TPR) repeat protein
MNMFDWWFHCGVFGQTKAWARAALVGLLACSYPVCADQTDARLSGLFNDLKVSESLGSALSVERQIWAIWSEVEGERVEREMVVGARALQARDWPRAIAAFTKVVELAPQFAEGWNKRATAYYLADDLDASALDIHTTLSLEPRHFGALSGMGLIFLQQGDLAGALMAFEQVLRVNPQSVPARTHVRELRTRLRRGAV